MKSEYDLQAEKFLNETDSKIDIQYLKTGKHFDNDKEERDIYTIKISRGSRSFSFEFGQSLNDSGFYYTMGKRKCYLDRKHLKSKNLLSIIRYESGGGFLNNGKSDIIHYPVEPSYYDILACLQKYDVGSFEDFCSEFGYDNDSRTAEKIYKAVMDEYNNLKMLYSDDEMEKLSEIQ